MLHTEKTDKAYSLLKSYARTREQHEAAGKVYVDILAETDYEDNVVMHLIDLVLDGLRYGNWLWNTPPTARNVILDSPPDKHQ